MPQRKIWVKRPSSSATQVKINEDDLVDDVRDMILNKYTNSLGRTFDSPDVSLKLVHRRRSARHSNHERVLGPEEVMCKVVDMHYPGGQSVEEALVIDVPQKRTPKHSPRLAMPYYMPDILRPGENGNDYFPPMAMPGPRSPHVSSNLSMSSGQAVPRQSQHAIAILETGQLPDLPSPGSRLSRSHVYRPKYGRQHTATSTVHSGATNSQNYDHHKVANSQPMPTPPIGGTAPDHSAKHGNTTPPRNSSPRPMRLSSKRSKKPADGQVSVRSVSTGLLDTAVPPINVLIVEDNIINLRLLEAFLKRLKVRWSTAMNGRDAVIKWREGGFHLVLMDIQLPIMNGLEATKEIRRLEKVNDIGIFTKSTNGIPNVSQDENSNEGLDDSRSNEANGQHVEAPEKIGEADGLPNIALFKSPVIIVALTASSLQSDRHEALAAGCNDFLTKPVNFDWLSRKVLEWGCMQALIDFDGWRNWKDFSNTAQKQPVATTPLKTVNGRNTPSPTVKAAGANGVAGPKGKRLISQVLGGIGEDVRDRSTSDDTEGTGTGTDTNGEGSGTEVSSSRQ